MNKLTVSASQLTSTFEHYVRKEISEDTSKAIACSMIDGRLEYCNCLLYGTSAANIHKLQCVQNSMARAVTNSRRNVHVKHVFTSLHWLLVEHCVLIKIAVTTFKVLTTQEQSFFSDLIQLHTPSRHLRSSSCNRLQQHQIKLALAERAFCQAAPAVWNSLPHSIASEISCFT